jgi:hypothetical protein
MPRHPLGQPPSLHPLRPQVAPSLFGNFVGTMQPLDSPPPCMVDLSLIAFSTRPAAFRPRVATGSLGSRAWSFYACVGSSTPQGAAHSRLSCTTLLSSVLADTVGSLIGRFRSSIPSPHMPLSNASSAASRSPSHGSGSGWSLLLSCVTLSFTTPRRFIPTLSSHDWLPHVGGSFPR